MGYQATTVTVPSHARLQENNFCDWHETYISIRWDTASWYTSSNRTKCYALFFLAVSGCKVLDTSLYFIMVNLHTEFKPRVKATVVSILILYATFRWLLTISKQYCFDQILKIGSLRSFVDWILYLAFLSKA